MQKPTNREQVIQSLRDQLPLLQERYGVVRMALFGSFAKGTPTDTSDVDLLVELSRPLGLEFVELANDIEEVLGRKADLATFETLSQSLRSTRRRPVAADVQRTLTYV